MYQLMFYFLGWNSYQQEIEITRQTERERGRQIDMQIGRERSADRQTCRQNKREELDRQASRYIDTQTDRQKDKRTSKQTYRQRDRRTDGQADRQIYYSPYWTTDKSNQCISFGVGDNNRRMSPLFTYVLDEGEYYFEILTHWTYFYIKLIKRY